MSTPGAAISGCIERKIANKEDLFFITHRYTSFEPKKQHGFSNLHQAFVTFCIILSPFSFSFFVRVGI